MFVEINESNCVGWQFKESTLSRTSKKVLVGYRIWNNIWSILKTIGNYPNEINDFVNSVLNS